MKLADATLSLAPTDLSNHLACPHVTTLDLAVAHGRRARPSGGLPNLQALQEKGLAHETAYIAHLRARGLSIDDLRGEPLTAAGAARTRAAMAAGTEVIVQAPLVFAAGRAGAEWTGRADVLRRVDTPSALGAWSYEVLDTKLARDARGSAILQLCVYSALVQRLQARMPAHLHIVSPGDGDPLSDPFETHTFRLDDYLAYYRSVLARFESAVHAAPPRPAGSAGVATSNALNAADEVNAADAVDAGAATDAIDAARAIDADHAVDAIASETYPTPAAHCDVCRWWADCDSRRRADDHLSLVAGVTRLQMQELQQRGLSTLERLARTPSPLPFTPQRGSAESLARTHGQARVQLDGRLAARAIYELLPLEPDRGLLRLPAPSPGDIFFDLEGDPFVGASGHEYLFGWAALEDDGDLRYTSHWAADAAAEKAAFQAFIAFVQARQARHPDLHIYHYAPYESGALRRLMGRHAVCEEEVDRLLRGHVLVDLHTVVRQSVRASVERYSIKELEIFYGFARATPLREAAAALRHLEYLLETGQPLATDDAARVTIERYNRDDCLSAAALRDWLEARRDEHEAAGRRVARPQPPPADASEALTEQQARVRALMDTLLAGVPVDVALRTPEEQGRWLMAHLLDFHRREDKATWWEFHRLGDLPDEDRLDESKALAGLTFAGTIGGTAKCPIDRYTFAAQECDVRAGDDLYFLPDVKEGKLGKVEAIDRDARQIDVKKTTKAARHHPPSVFATSRVPLAPLPDALLRLATSIADERIDADAGGDGHDDGDGDHDGHAHDGDVHDGGAPTASGSLDDAVVTGERLLHDDASIPASRLPASRLRDAFAQTKSAPARSTSTSPAGLAARDLLTRRAPRLVAGTPWLVPGESTVARARRLALALDGGVLPIQGPPGAGKSYAGARIICELIAAGRKVGVTGPNHAVITHLLRGVEQAAAAEGLRVRMVQKAKEESEPQIDAAADPAIRQMTDNESVLAALQDGSAQVGAGTAWLWARADYADAVDVLVIDEAGQMSLANALAVAGAARSIVLLGDPQQLEQPLQGSHPDGAAVSVLQHVLGEHQTIPDTHGLFLGETWRLHPAVCAFTSEVFYEGRLASHAGLDRQRLTGDTPLAGAGLWFHPVPHEGNQNHAPEEVEAIARLVSHLLDAGGTQWVDATGTARPLVLSDLLVVAPYNAQVYALRDRLPGLRVGTVDRFQGQEAPLVIYSMTTSSPDDAPRGMEFLYSLNRLNVATSRARGVVLLVASPRLLQPECQTPRQMRLANAFCRYVELATPLPALPLPVL